MTVVKPKTLAPVILLMLLPLAATEVFFVHPAQANPYRRDVKFTEVSPPAGAQPPEIIIHTPQNGSFYPKNFNLTFDVSVPKTNGDKSLDAVTELYYKGSWDPNQIRITQFNERGYLKIIEDFASFSIDLSEIPGGNHSLAIYAKGSGSYDVDHEFIDAITILYHVEGFEMTGYSTVSFTKDVVSPRITFLSPPNRTYITSDVELDFTISESASEILYSLDGKQNQTIAASLTLTDLTEGAHNVTLYAADLAGNAAEPEKLFFNVELPEPFPIITLATASGGSVAIIGAGLLVYFKKCKKVEVRTE